jgi:hypothetical protein
VVGRFERQFLASKHQETWSVKKLELALWQTRSHDGIGLVQ